MSETESGLTTDGPGKVFELRSVKAALLNFSNLVVLEASIDKAKNEMN